MEILSPHLNLVSIMQTLPGLNFLLIYIRIPWIGSIGKTQFLMSGENFKNQLKVSAMYLLYLRQGGLVN
jgi:hypothetical protein